MRKFSRRHMLATMTAFPMLNLSAQETRPLRIVVPYTAGGGLDAVVRALANSMERVTGRPVLVDNKPGASTAIGAMEVKRAVPDGKTVLFTTSATLMQLPNLRKDLPYDPFKDFTFITDFIRNPQPLMAYGGLPCNTLAELVAYVKANPGKVSYATVAVGGSGHINMEVFRLAEKLDMTQISYKGTTDALKDLLPGRVQLILDNHPSYPELVKEGKLKVLAVTGTKRMATMATAPTFIEQGYPTTGVIGGFSVYGPAGLSKDVTLSLFNEITAAARDDKVRLAVQAQSGEFSFSSSPDSFLAASKKEFDVWGEAIRKAQIKLD